MKRNILLLSVLAPLLLNACDKKTSEKPFIPDPVKLPAVIFPADPLPEDTLPSGHPPINNDQASSDESDVDLTQNATVISTIDIPQFTYIEVKQNNQTRWLASRTVALKKGDSIQFDHGETVEDFNSKALHRTFASITFINRATVVKNK